MVIWINGAFGAGKTTTAYELLRRHENAVIYDPEEVGFFLQKNIPKELCFPDFQDMPLWRSLNANVIEELANNYKGDIIIPMTVTNRDYYNAITRMLFVQGHEVKHFILTIPKEEILKRNRKRFCFYNSWPAKQADRCLKAFEKDMGGIKIDTLGKPVHVVVDAIAAYCGIDIPPERRPGLRRLLDRTLVKINHIR